MDNIWIALAGVITTITSGFASWFFAKRKYNAEVDNNLITNMQSSLEFYKSLADDNKQRLDDVLQENVNLRKEVGEVSQENASLKQEVKELRDMVDKLTMRLANYGLYRLLEDADADSIINKTRKEDAGNYNRQETPAKKSSKTNKEKKA